MVLLIRNANKRTKMIKVVPNGTESLGRPGDQLKSFSLSEVSIINRFQTSAKALVQLIPEKAD